MNRDIIRQTAVVIAYIAMVTVNVLANALPINGQNTGDISDRFAIYFVPAGWVFAIWLPIYLGLGAYAIYQATRTAADEPAVARDRLALRRELDLQYHLDFPVAL